ncbi:MAG: linear amide C-N hydrolase, partial [Muribaculaceae bacterium]|nr:linear amide C-N hydrolase [Muribaculaceae bacterium]
PVLTNDPPFEQMLAINNYWEGVGGQNFLPGSVKSPDRFTRASFFDKHVDKTNDLNEGLAIIRSILNNVSVPFKYNLGDKNLSSTQWRSFANLRDKTYYFENVNDLGLYYIDLKKCDLRPGASVMKLDTQKATEYVGDVTSKLVKTKPFTPMY